MVRCQPLAQAKTSQKAESHLYIMFIASGKVTTVGTSLRAVARRADRDNETRIEINTT